MSNKFNINGSVSISGDLNVKGSTNTVNQETLTIKDNLIAVNGNGTTLETSGMAGIVAITGKQNSLLKNGNYRFDFDYIYKAFNPSVQKASWEGAPEDQLEIVMNDSFGESITALDLIPKAVNGLSGEYIDSFQYFYPDGKYGYFEFRRGAVDAYIRLTSPRDSENGIWIFNINADAEPGKLNVFHLPSTISFYFENQGINQSDIPLIKSILLKEDGSQLTDSDFVIKGEAYAAPIYDKNEDSLKIGLGSYEKDGKGNIQSFVFNAGQGQNIATRANDIANNRLLKWNGKQYRLEQSPITAFGKSIKVDGNIGAKGNFVIVNTDAESLDEVNAAGTLSVTGKEVAVLKAGIYHFDYNKIAVEINPKWDKVWHDEFGGYYELNLVSWNEEFVNRFNSLNLISTTTEWFGYNDGPQKIGIGCGKGVYSFGIGYTCLVGPNGDSYDVMIQGEDAKYYFENQIIDLDQFEFLSQYMYRDYTGADAITQDDVQIKGEAYASPIYDTASGKIKIGQGTYERDFNGNVTKFEFSSGQGKELVEEWEGDRGGYYTLRCRAMDGKGVSTTRTLLAYNAPKDYAIALYAYGGVLQTNSPTAEKHCANKKYVDESIAACGSFEFEDDNNGNVILETSTGKAVSFTDDGGGNIVIESKALDIQINGTSIVEKSIANIPTANGSTLGVVKVYENGDAYSGISVKADGTIALVGSNAAGALSDAFFTNPQYYAAPILSKDLYRWMEVGLTQNSRTLTNDQKTSACGWLGALKQNTSKTSKHQAYIKNASGGLLMFDIENGPVPSTLCMRDGNGRLRIVDPIQATDCATKGYVDNAVANAGSGGPKYFGLMNIGLADLQLYAFETNMYLLRYIHPDGSKTLYIASEHSGTYGTYYYTPNIVSASFVPMPDEEGVFFDRGPTLPVGTYYYKIDENGQHDIDGVIGFYWCDPADNKLKYNTIDELGPWYLDDDYWYDWDNWDGESEPPMRERIPLY